MAVPAEVLKIEPWAASGDREDPEDVGIVRSTGWTVAFEQVGGSRVQRTVVQQLLFEVTSFCWHRLRDGLIPWHAGVDYEHPAFVVGSDGALYRSRVDSGPALGNAADPATQAGAAVWEVY